MSNLSKIRREKMIEFLETLKEQHSDDESLIAINQTICNDLHFVATWIYLYNKVVETI